MTPPDRFEQHLPELMAELAPARVPDYFDDILRATARTRQRPAWSSLERWLPMDVALPSARSGVRSVTALAALLLIALLISAAVLAYVGSHQTRVPSPFGPAANGSMYYTASSGVFAVDAAVGTPQAILAATDSDGVLPSRNGLRIAVMHKLADGEQLSVADADGKNDHPLPGTFTNFSEIDWSPTDAQVAIVSDVKGVPSISILQADGSGTATTLALGLEVHNFWYLPDGRFVFHGSSTSGATTFGLYTANADGTSVQAIAPPTAVDNWLSMSPSGDGTRLVSHRWVDDPFEHGRLHITDVAHGTDTMVQVAATLPSDEFEEATFSPDGQDILFKWFTANGDVRLAMVPADGGTAVLFGPAVHYDVSPNALFSPDGRTVEAYYPSLKELWLLDPTGGRNGGDRKLALPVSDVPTWQRIAP